MPHWLSDPSLGTYTILIVVTLVMYGIYFRTKNRGSLIRATVFLVLLIAVFVIDRMYESPREESTRRNQEIVDALNKRDWGKMSEHISESFEYQGMKKADGRKFIELAKGSSKLEFTSWSYSSDTRYNEQSKTCEIEFDFKASGYPKQLHFKATYIRDPDGKYRMKGFEAFDALDKSQFIIPVGLVQ